MTPATFAILVHGTVKQCESHQSAQNFIKAAIQLGHAVDSVFFYGDACSISIKHDDLQHNESQVQQNWLELSLQHKIPLQACISSSIKRGVVDLQQSEETDENINIADGFMLTGLGSLAETLHANFKIIEFGA